MNDHRSLARGWLLKADSDLANARRTVESEGPYDTGCFHVQQAIEKWLKAFLAYHRQPIPRTHDLEELAVLCQQIDRDIELPLCELVEITDFGVQIRYDLDAWPTQEEARKAVEGAERLREIVLNQMPRDILSS